jgi:hypothetical protein
MARIYIDSDEDELPDLVDVLKGKELTRRNPKERKSSTTTEEPTNFSLPRKGSRHEVPDDGNNEELRTEKPSQRRQRPLKRVENNSILLQPLKVLSNDSTLDKESKRRTQAPLLQDVNTKVKTAQRQHSEEVEKSWIASEDASRNSEEENTLDDIEFWSKPRPLKSPPQPRPPPETPRAARIKARLFRRPPPLKDEPGNLLVFQPEKADTVAPRSRPTSSNDDHSAFLT